MTPSVLICVSRALESSRAKTKVGLCVGVKEDLETVHTVRCLSAHSGPQGPIHLSAAPFNLTRRSRSHSLGIDGLGLGYTPAVSWQG